MAENKFIKHLKGEQAVGSLVEIKNQNTPASFGNMPQGTSDSNVKYADVRGDVTVVANGTMAWKINDSALTLAPIVNGDGTDYISNYAVSGAGLWVNSTYTFPSTGDPNHPVAMIFNPNTKWVLKLCGDNLIVNNGETLELTVVITIGSSNIISKQFTVREQATHFCKELVIDFDESNSALIKAMGLSTMQLQVLCGTADASARIYNGMTTLTVLQRKVDAAVVSGTFANVEEVLRDGILPSDYFNNAAYIAQIEDGDSAYAVFTRDGDTVALSGWAQPIPDQTNNAGKFLTTDGSLMSWAQLTISDVDGLSTELSDLQDQIDDLSGRGRYLSIWNCTTGLAESNPPESPYTYQSGDYFIVGTVGATNYRPDGSSYTTGVASTTIETAEVKVDDVYLYDGTNWKLLASSQRTYTFAGIAGSPYDNTNLGNALDSKVNKNADITGATKCKITYDSKGLVTAGADLAEGDIPSLHLSKISDVTASASEVNVLDGITASTSELNVLDGITATTTELNYTDGVTSNIQTQLDAKQANLTAGTGIDIIGATISNSGVRSVSSGTANGTISVNTNGTSADVSVTGLGSAAYTSSSDYATAAQGAKADTAVQPSDLGNGTITITQGGITKGTFTTNQSGDTTIALDAGGGGIGNIDNLTITANADDEIQTVATINANTATGATNPIYDWVGTLAEYNAQSIESLHPDWVCFITDDLSAEAYEAYTKGETLNLFVQKGHQVIEFQAPTSANNYTWYRKYADGWIEQGGLQTSATGSSGVTVTLPVAMADANYTITATVTGEPVYFVGCLNKTTTSFLWRSFNRLGEGYDKAGSWQVSGMAA